MQWGCLLVLFARHCGTAGPKGGHLPMLLETMLQAFFLQKKNVLRDPMAEVTRFNRGVAPLCRDQTGRGPYPPSR